MGNNDAKEQIQEAMQLHLDNLTKPRGSLGKLEDYALKMAFIQGKVPPLIGKKGVYVFAGDHGIAAEGVSLYPQEVTAQMVLNILTGGAGINALSAGTGFEITIIDAGVLGPSFDESAGKAAANTRFLNRKIMQGSRNFYHENGMTSEQTKEALKKGRELADDAAGKGYYLTAIGDLGIGNTSSAAALLAAGGFHVEDMVDRGTGIDLKMLDHKRSVIKEALTKRGYEQSGEGILAAFGSPDFAMMAGFILGLEGRGIGCVLDGFPVSSAAYMAYLINPRVSDYLFAGHLSRVAGHKPVLDRMGLSPIVNLDMRLGEGTGAVTGAHIIELGLLAARNMASFADAHVSDTGKNEEKY